MDFIDSRRECGWAGQAPAQVRELLQGLDLRNQAIRMKVIEIGEPQRDGGRVLSEEGPLKCGRELAGNALKIVPIHSQRAPGDRWPSSGAFRRTLPAAEIAHE